MEYPKIRQTASDAMGESMTQAEGGEDHPTIIRLAPREEFFNAYWSALDARGWTAVVLHSWQDFPERIASDIDYAVTGMGSGELLRFLANFSRARGWRLVQVIEHEPGAFYCLCIQADSPFAWLALDVTWDYRRLGHLLVRSEILVSNRRRVAGKSFAVPAPGGEFCYTLAKGAAKGKDFSLMRDRLAELLAEDSSECCRAAERAFGDDFPAGSGDVAHLAALADWFAQASCFRAVRAGRKLRIREISRYLRRILRPTGFWLTHPGECGGEGADYLTPAFWRIQRRGRVALWDLPGLLLRVIRTTLVIEQKQDRDPAPGRLRSWLGRAVWQHPSANPGEMLEFLAKRVDRRIAHQR